MLIWLEQNKMPNLKIHSDGYIIGGNHHRGLMAVKNAKRQIKAYLENEIKCKNIVIKQSKDLSNKITYSVKREPVIARGSYQELAILRARQFLIENQNKPMSLRTFYRNALSVVDNFIDKYKC